MTHLDCFVYFVIQNNNKYNIYVDKLTGENLWSIYLIWTAFISQFVQPVGGDRMG